MFEAACSAAAEYLVVNCDLNTVANGYSVVLSEFYQPINLKKWLRDRQVLGRANAGETAAPLATGFCYNKIMFEQPTNRVEGIVWIR